MADSERLFQLLPMTLLVLVAAGSAWLYGQISERLEAPAPAPGQGPLAVAEQVVLTTYYADGRPHHRLWSPRLSHIAETGEGAASGDGVTEMESPYLELYEPGAPPWKVRAGQGRLSQGGAELYLSGSVSMERDARPPDDPPLAAYSDWVRCFPDRDYVETEAAVDFERPGLQVTGRGMRAWLTQERLELHHDVTTRIVPRASGTDAPQSPPRRNNG